MKKITKLLFVELVFILLPAHLIHAETTLYTNVNGYTLNSNRELLQFSALEFTDDKISRLYSQGDELPSDIDVIVDGNGQTLIPGLIDAHGHVLSYGLSLLRVDLTGAASEQDAVQRVVDFFADNRQLDWIQGRGWNQVLWDSNAFPNASSLDAMFSEKPIWLTRVDGHAGWANSVAMERAGVESRTLDPDGGQIIRDEDGNPTGVFVDNAMALIRSQIPASSIEEQKFALTTAMHELAKQGLTSVHDAGVGSSSIRAYKQLLQDGPLPIRVNAMLSATDSAYEQRLAEGHFRSEDDTFTINSVKIAADGMARPIKSTDMKTRQRRHFVRQQ